MTMVKVCGLTNKNDLMAALEAGADMVGFIHVPKSPRFVSVAQLRSLLEAVPPGVQRVIVVQDLDSDELDHLRNQLAFDHFQFHGQETPELVARHGGYKVIHVRGDQFNPCMAEAFPGMVMLDTQWGSQRGGSGRTFQWSILRGLEKPSIVAGGLRPENVSDLIANFKPWGVDVCSGIEKCPGQKDHAAMTQFISKVRSVPTS